MHCIYNKAVSNIHRKYFTQIFPVNRLIPVCSIYIHCSTASSKIRVQIDPAQYPRVKNHWSADYSGAPRVITGPELVPWDGTHGKYGTRVPATLKRSPPPPSQWNRSHAFARSLCARVYVHVSVRVPISGVLRQSETGRVLRDTRVRNARPFPACQGS